MDARARTLRGIHVLRGQNFCIRCGLQIYFTAAVGTRTTIHYAAGEIAHRPGGAIPQILCLRFFEFRFNRCRVRNTSIGFRLVSFVVFVARQLACIGAYRILGPRGRYFGGRTLQFGEIG